MEDSAVELWPGGARVRTFLDLRPSGPLAGMLYMRAGIEIEDCTGAALLVFTVMRGKVSVKLNIAGGGNIYNNVNNNINNNINNSINNSINNNINNNINNIINNNNNSTNINYQNCSGRSWSFSASVGSVLEVPPRSRYSLACQSEAGAQLSFIVITLAFAAGVGSSGAARVLTAPSGTAMMTSATEVA